MSAWQEALQIGEAGANLNSGYRPAKKNAGPSGKVETKIYLLSLQTAPVFRQVR